MDRKRSAVPIPVTQAPPGQRAAGEIDEGISKRLQVVRISLVARCPGRASRLQRIRRGTIGARRGRRGCRARSSAMMFSRENSPRDNALVKYPTSAKLGRAVI